MGEIDTQHTCAEEDGALIQDYHSHQKAEVEASSPILMTAYCKTLGKKTLKTQQGTLCRSRRGRTPPPPPGASLQGRPYEQAPAGTVECAPNMCREETGQESFAEADIRYVIVSTGLPTAPTTGTERGARVTAYMDNLNMLASKGVVLAYDFAGSSLSWTFTVMKEFASHSPPLEQFKDASESNYKAVMSGPERGTVKAEHAASALEADAIYYGLSEWFKLYKSQIKGALRAVAFQPNVKVVCAVCITGGPITRVERMYMADILKEAREDFSAGSFTALENVAVRHTIIESSDPTGTDRTWVDTLERMMERRECPYPREPGT